MVLSKKYLNFLVIGTTILFSVGCVTRTITINTNPSYAQVYVDDEFVGESPATVPFTYYGTRKITIEKRDPEGKLLYERKMVFEKIKTPTYQVFPLDFFTDIVWPFNIKDNHTLNYDLVELEPLARKELQRKVIEGAEELRQQVNLPDF